VFKLARLSLFKLKGGSQMRCVGQDQIAGGVRSLHVVLLKFVRPAVTKFNGYLLAVSVHFGPAARLTEIAASLPLDWTIPQQIRCLSPQ